MDYTSLIPAVQAYDPEIAANTSIPFSTLLLEMETELQPTIRHYLTEKTVTVPAVGSVVTLPSDFIEARKISVGTTLLKPVSIYGSTLYTGEIGYVMTGNTLQLVNASNVNVEITYFSRFLTLSEANPTNWIIERFPGVYIHGLLARVYRWLRDPEGEATAKASQQQALSALAADNARYERGGNQLDLGGQFSW